MKAKILAALKTKYPNLGLGDSSLERIAAWLEPGVKEEKDIETAVAGVEPVLKLMQSSADTFRNEKAGLIKELEDYKKKALSGKENEDVDKNKVLTEDGVKSIVSELLKPITERFSEQDENRKEEERRGQIIAKAAEYKIPEAVAKYMQVPPDADLDVFMKQAKQDFADNGFSEVKPPQTAEQQMKTDGENIAKMISDATKTIVESQKN